MSVVVGEVFDPVVAVAFSSIFWFFGLLQGRVSLVLFSS